MKKQIESLRGELEVEFKTGLTELLAAHPEVSNINVRINNHEFNDGDATYFGLHWEDMNITFTDGEEEYEDDGYMGDVPEKFKGIRDKFKDYFGVFDDEEFWETAFRDAYESINFSLQEGQLSY